jgi:hypothetical protein
MDQFGEIGKMFEQYFSQHFFRKIKVFSLVYKWGTDMACLFIHFEFACVLIGHF